jgi:hypothetical protein
MVSVARLVPEQEVVAITQRGAPWSTLRAVERSRLSPFGLVLLALVTVAWGLSWPAIKIVLAEVPPLTFRAICLVAGGAGVLVLARLAGQSLRVPAHAWGRLLVIAACNIVGWNTFKIYGIAHLPSGRAALIGYTMPMWSTLFSVWLLGERLTPRRGAAPRSCSGWPASWSCSPPTPRAWRAPPSAWS